MATPTLDALLERLTCTERTCSDLARQTRAHGQILEKVQARLTELERAPRATASRAAAFESEWTRDFDRFQSRLYEILEKVQARLTELERASRAAAELTPDEPTGYEDATDRQLLELVIEAVTNGRAIDDGVFSEAKRRVDE